MPRPGRGLRDGSRALALAAALLGTLGVAGCDLQEDADLERGERLFSAKCAQCHALNAIGNTETVIGPNLDSAFAEARARGMDQDTIEGVVESQIANPRPADPDQSNVYMPPELYTGEDAEDVAAYVASVAGVPGIEPPGAGGPPGLQVFIANGCGGCHTLEAAQSTGTSGPNLDDNLAGQDPQQIETSIVDPSAEIVQGFPDIMPAGYEQSIAPEDLKALVEFLSDCSGDPEAKGCS